jgi:GT2 family glycosyltransferase
MISVVVPSYRRAASLRTCLDGLSEQVTGPGEIIVVLRREDADSETVVRDHGPASAQVVFVEEPGVLHAMLAGARASTGDIVAFLDDDAVAPPDWMSRLSDCLEADVGAVGGRDRIPDQHEPRTADVGRVTKWGRVVGNHHLGIGEPRDVDVLKGVNMAIRRELVAIPDGLKGTGAQNHFELAMLLHVRRAGWRVLYDPEVVVDHHPAKRHDNDARGAPDAAATRAASFNLVLCLLTFRPDLTCRRALYGLLLGDGGTPGILRGLVGLARRERAVVRAVVPSLRGQLDALRRIRAGQPARMLDLGDRGSHV